MRAETTLPSCSRASRSATSRRLSANASGAGTAMATNAATASALNRRRRRLVIDEGRRFTTGILPPRAKCVLNRLGGLPHLAICWIGVPSELRPEESRLRRFGRSWLESRIRTRGLLRFAGKRAARGETPLNLTFLLNHSLRSRTSKSGSKVKGGFATRATPAFWRGTFDNHLKSSQKRSFQANGTVGRFRRMPEATECRPARESGL